VVVGADAELEGEEFAEDGVAVNPESSAPKTQNGPDQE
jgi:hypothetical protein